jgi:hypothetical protein
MTSSQLDNFTFCLYRDIYIKYFSPALKSLLGVKHMLRCVYFIVNQKRHVITNIALNKDGAAKDSVLKRWCEVKEVQYNGTVTHHQTYSECLSLFYCQPKEGVNNMKKCATLIYNCTVHKFPYLLNGTKNPK